ncbi:hypothetical protein [Streptomyces sp. NPDC005408]|uniref:hypothetical protein n=1 Tax=Streptomyces sp. NPDC005408 TaxID=3155341 RepID=UPI0033B5574B
MRWLPDVLRGSSRGRNRDDRAPGAAPLARALSELGPGTADFIRQLADELIDEFAPAGKGRVDLMGAFVQRLPLLVMMGLLGMDERYAAGVGQAVPDLLAGARTSARLDELMLQLVEEKTETPGRDLVSWMVHYASDASVREIAHQTRLLLLAAVEECTALLGSCLLPLLDPGGDAPPEEQRPGLPRIAERAMRHSPPIPELFGRVATRDTLLGNALILQGDPVIISLAAADGPAPNSPTTATLGHGQSQPVGTPRAHACPEAAAPLTWLVVATGLDRLAFRLHNLRLSMPARELLWGSAHSARSPQSLPVEFLPGRPDVTADVQWLPDCDFINAPPPQPAAPHPTDTGSVRWRSLRHSGRRN